MCRGGQGWKWIEKNHIVRREENTMSGNEHPKGALVFMLLFLLVLVLLWINAYLKLWG
jgi:hypothetical protein